MVLPRYCRVEPFDGAPVISSCILDILSSVGDLQARALCSFSYPSSLFDNAFVRSFLLANFCVLKMREGTWLRGVMAPFRRDIGLSEVVCRRVDALVGWRAR